MDSIAARARVRYVLHMPLGVGDARLVAGELERLFGIRLARRHDRDFDFTAVVASLEQAVASEPRQEQLRDLLSALASDRTTPFHALVRDLSEILFLPRAERWEYACKPRPPGPWVFPKLMLEYAVWTRRLDAVIGGALARFCSSHCPSPPVGCCYLLGYDMGLVPEGMLRTQELEARLHGWRMPPDPDRHKCRYHTTTGCALRLFKTPACLQYVCQPMAEELSREYGVDPARDLIDSLHVLGACDIDRASVFEKLMLAVRAAERCVMKKSIGGPAAPRPTSE